MKKFTNKLNLPESFVRAAEQDDYDRGDCDITITQLIDSPRIAELERLHEHEIETDAADLIFIMLGKGVHKILQENVGLKAVSEKRLFAEIEGWKISGQFDLYDELDTLTDYKVTSIWVAKRGGVRPDWVSQLNSYAALLRINGYNPPKKAQINAVFRDWSLGMARREPELPQKQVQIYNIPLWSHEQAMAYLAERVRIHQRARITLPLCTNEERWPDPKPWAVYAAGQRKRAKRIFATKEEALAFFSSAPSQEIVERQAYKRCLDYCKASRFCSQFKDLLAELPAESQPAPMDASV